MKIDDSLINHNDVRLIDGMIDSFDDNDVMECNDEHRAIAIGYVKGVSDMANAMKDVLKFN